MARVKLNSERLLWEELSPVEVDTHKLEHLFESRAKDFITKVNYKYNYLEFIIIINEVINAVYLASQMVSGNAKVKHLGLWINIIMVLLIF